MGRRRRAAIAVVSGMIALSGTFLGAATPAAAQSSTATAATAIAATDAYCAVTVNVINSWPGGYMVGLTIKNISTVPVRWEVLTYRIQNPVQGFWLSNATATQSGSVLTIVPSPPRVLAPGESVMVGGLLFSGTPPIGLANAMVTCSPA